MIYALWDNETNNLVAEYDNRHDALALVLRGIERNGVDDANVLSLEAEDEHGKVMTVASGKDLVELAQREVAAV